jgi:UDP-glucose 4-epimerase
MRVLITGGAGFVGSHLVDHFVERGHDVTVLDDFSTGSRRNLSHLREGAIRVVEGKVEDEQIVRPFFERGVDLAFHLAASVGVFEILEHPLHALRSNLVASDTLFSIASEHGTRTIFTSTSEVYGKNNADGLRESDDSVFGPTSIRRWLYGVSKAADEFMGLAHHTESGLPITVVRLFNTTGPRQTGRYGMVVPRFVEQALTGDPITVFGPGSQTRCFTNVFDVVRALTLLAATPESVGEVVNVGRPVEISISVLADTVRRVLGSESPIVYEEYADAYGQGFEDMRRRVPNVDKLRTLTGYAPSTPLELTIRQIAAGLSERPGSDQTVAAGPG